MPPSSHSWHVRDRSGLLSVVQVFGGPSVTRWAQTSWLPRAVASSGPCHQHHSYLGTASVPGVSPHHVWDGRRTSASHCLMGTQLFSSFTTITPVLCCLLPRRGLLLWWCTSPNLIHTHWETPTLGCGGGGWAFPVSLSSTTSLTQWNPVPCQDRLWSWYLQDLPAECCQGASLVADGGHLPGVRGLAQFQSGCKLCNTWQWCPLDYSALAKNYWPKPKKPLGTCWY